MTLKEQSFALCKEIWKSPFRDETSTLLGRLNSTKHEEVNTQNDRSEYGYYSRRFNLQFCGYLTLDYSIRNKQLPGDLLGRLPALTDSERVVLSRAHKTLLELNTRCLSKLLESIPSCKIITDPYYGHELEITDMGGRLLEPASIQMLGLIFDKYRPVSWALETIDSVGILNDNQYLDLIKRLGDTISISTNIGEGLLRTVLTKDAQTQFLLKHCFSLMAIKESLKIVDQLIYQAVTKDKLPFFGTSNVVSIDSEAQGFYGTRYKFTCLPVDDSVYIEPGDVVLYQPNESDKPRLCEVVRESMSMSQSDGTLFQLELIGINDELHPFDAILNNFNVA